ncbi:MAG: hypothetical protein K2L96_09070 [Muribaculaceae bacterium]|nr:hypothetical protein [Muribaculaceae bacterium]
MRKFLLTALAAFSFSAAFAAETTVEPLADTSSFERPDLSQPRRVSVPKGEWNNIGTGIWFDDLFSYYQLVSPGDSWEITFEQSAENPAWYRVLPYGPESPVAKLIGDDDTENYVYINTADPDKVYIPDFLAFDTYRFSQHVDENGWWDETEYGTLKDGVITFPANCFGLQPSKGEPWSRVNASGKMKIALPGTKLDDFTLKLECPFCVDDEGKVRIVITRGADLVNVKYALLEGEYFAEGGNIDAVVAQGYDLVGEALRATPRKRAIFSLLAVGLDRNNSPVAATQCFFFGPDSADEDTWILAGTANFTESIFCSIYGNLTAEALIVPYEESLENPGRIRLIEPYSEHGFAPVLEHAHPHYLYIDAMAPSAVYVEASPIGADFGGGQSAVWSLAGRYVHYGMASEAYNLGLFGTRTGNVITMPDNTLLVGEKNYAGGEFAAVGRDFRISLRPSQSGIENVALDSDSDAEARYFTIDGKALPAAPAAPGLYIRKTPAATTKVLIR